MTGNCVTIIGNLVENKLRKGVTGDGRGYINGYISVSDGENRMKVDAMAMEQNKSGENPSYKEWMTIMNEGVTEDKENNVVGSIIKIAPSKDDENSNGKIENADYYDANNHIVKSVKLMAPFPRIIKELAEKEQTGGFFSFTGYIESIIEEIKNDAPSGRLNVSLIGIKYGDIANQFSVIIPKEIASMFSSVHMVGQTATISGTIVNLLETKVIQEVVSWGAPQSRTVNSVIREFIATGGSGPFNESDIKTLSIETINEAKTKREEELQEQKKKFEARAAAKQAQNAASTGFSGNPGAFTTATTPPIPGGRPQF